MSFSDIREGMQVYGADDQAIGTIERMERDSIIVNGERLPMGAVDRVIKNRVYVKAAGASGMLADATTAQAEGTIRVPVMEERLGVSTRQVEQGEVTLHKTVEQEQVSVPVELRRDEVHVERRDTEDRLVDATGMADAFKEGTIRVPVRGEEAVVTKQAYQTGEVTIDKEQVVERQEIRDTVRRERVEVDENYQKVRADLQQHFTRTPAAAAGRTFEEVEPIYQRGYAAAADERYASKSFEEIEPELREQVEQTGAGADSGWDQLRESVRIGWERARGK